MKGGREGGRETGGEETGGGETEWEKGKEGGRERTCTAPGRRCVWSPQPR